MNTEKLSSWLAVLANIGVLAGVVFLALEIRQNTNMVQMGNLQSSIALAHESGSWLLDSEFAAVYGLGLTDFAALSDTQELQFDEFFGQRLNLWEFAFNAHRTGAMSDVGWSSWDLWYASWIRGEQLRRLWETSKRADYAGSGDFLAHVDSVVADAGPSPM